MSPCSLNFPWESCLLSGEFFSGGGEGVSRSVGLLDPALLSKSWKHFRLAFVSEESLLRRGGQGLLALSASPPR